MAVICGRPKIGTQNFGTLLLPFFCHHIGSNCWTDPHPFFSTTSSSQDPRQIRPEDWRLIRRPSLAWKWMKMMIQHSGVEVPRRWYLWPRWQMQCCPEINPQSRVAAAEAHRFHQHSVRLPELQTLWINSKTRHSRMLWCYIIPERQEKARDIFALPHTERMMFYDVLWFRACVPKDAILRLHHVHSNRFS